MSGEDLVSTWLSVLGGLMLKSLIVFLIAEAALLALRRASASARHLVCLLTLTGLLALPLLSLALPGWRLAVLAAPQSAKEPTPRQVAAPPETGGGGVLDAGKVGAASGIPTPLALTSSSSRFGRTPASEANKEVGSAFPWLIALSALWFCGVLLAALRPLLGLWGIARLSQTSIAVLDAPTLALTAECASALGLSRTPTLRQAEAPVPMTWGWRQPVVLLPVGAQDWPEGRLRAVLLHELAHIRRRDWLSHRFADLVCALYWFHPLAWLTARRLRTEGEIACDDLVLTSGIAAPDYARHLLDVARALRPIPDIPQAAIAMARTARIEGRLTMILDATRPRRALTRRALLLVLGLSAAALVPLAVMRPVVRAQAAAPSAASPRSLTTLHVTAARPALVAAGGVPVQLANVYSYPWKPQGQGQRRFGFYFHIPTTAQDVTVKYDLTDCLFSGSAGTWQAKMQSTSHQTEAQLNPQTNGSCIVTATFPASVSKTNIRVGLASGPWKVVASTGHSASGPIAGLGIQRGDTGYIFSPLAKTKEGAVLTVSVNTVPHTSADDFRVIAVDGQGRKVLPADIGDRSVGALDQITARFALPLAQIVAIRLESRPFHYVEFRDVALRPAR